MSKFHLELKKLKSIFRKNGYPLSFIDGCIKRFFEKLYVPKIRIPTVTKKELLIVLPYLGKLSLQTRSRLNKIVHSNLPSCKAIFVFKSNAKLSSFFTFKDKISKELQSGVVYKYSCGDCNANAYYGKTKRRFKVRACEHAGISPLTGKRLASNPYQTSAVKEHMLTCNHIVSFDDFSVLANSNNNFHLELKESLFILRDNPVLNKNITSVPLQLFG